jgi:hypothetical protein
MRKLVGLATAAVGAVFLLGLLFAGCDMGSKTLDFAADIDGTVDDDQVAETIGDEMEVGIDASDNAQRGFVSFDFSSIKPSSGDLEVVSAVFTVYMANFNLLPYDKLGPVLIDRVDFGTSLDGTDWSDEIVEASNIGTLSNSTDDWLKHASLDVTDQVEAVVSSGSYVLQLRLRHENDTSKLGQNLDASHTDWATTEHVDDNPPVLTVTYK